MLPPCSSSSVGNTLALHANTNAVWDLETELNSYFSANFVIQFNHLLTFIPTCCVSLPELRGTQCVTISECKFPQTEAKSGRTCDARELRPSLLLFSVCPQRLAYITRASLRSILGAAPSCSLVFALTLSCHSV
jgi:hypothetical protein